MAQIDVDMLLEHLSVDISEAPIILEALEQLCMQLLMSNNIDRFFQRYPPKTFLPVLAKIFLNEQAADNILEVAIRAMTYYLDMSSDCSSYILQSDGMLLAICNRLVIDFSSQSSRDLAEQCVKALELICNKNSTMVYTVGGMCYIMTFIRENGSHVHVDTVQSAMKVLTKLCGMFDLNSTSALSYIESLMILLLHSDAVVSDGAVKCFSLIVDSIITQQMDPSPLGLCGAVEELLNMVISPGRKHDTVASVILLLSKMCHNSRDITKRLLDCKLKEAIEASMANDERCMKEWIKLVDFLLSELLACGEVLQNNGISTASAQLRGFDTIELSHIKLIDEIRYHKPHLLHEIKKFKELLPNFTDSAGQTLLNWAAAHSPPEVVKYLLDRGADSKKGKFGSALHFAVYFCRPDIVKVLLHYGANPQLKDIRGNTPLDLARVQRNDIEGKKIIGLLKKYSNQPVIRELPLSDHAKTESYLKFFLKLFCKSCIRSTLTDIRYPSLEVINMIVHNARPNFIDCYGLNTNLTSDNPLVEVFASVLDDEDDIEGHLLVLRMLCDIMSESKINRQSIERLGIFCKVRALYEDDPVDVTPDIEQPSKPTSEASTNSANDAIGDADVEDAKIIEIESKYHWHRWHVYSSRQCLFMWTEETVLQLLLESDGWFRFRHHGKWFEIFTSGHVHEVQNNIAKDAEVMQCIVNLKLKDHSLNPSQPIHSTPSDEFHYCIGNWLIWCTHKTRLEIRNIETTQRIILDANFFGFQFEGRYLKRQHFPKNDHSEQKSKKNRTPHILKTKPQEDVKRKLAYEIFTKYTNESRGKLSKASIRLIGIVQRINSAIHHDEKLGHVWYARRLCTSLKELSELINTDGALSAFEMQSSGLVETLLELLSSEDPTMNMHLKQRKMIFRNCFLNSMSGNSIKSGMKLVKKLIAILESTEKFPVYKYSSTSGTGLQSLAKQFNFVIERAESESVLFERQGFRLKSEPLVTVRQLKAHLLKILTKQWHEKGRDTFHYLNELRENKEGMVFTYSTDFDKNGLIYFIGSNGKTSEWANPAKYGMVKLSCCSGPLIGKLENMLSRVDTTLFQTSDKRTAWIAIDLGVFIIPHAYTLRNSTSLSNSALKNWLLLASRDNFNWTTLRKHADVTDLMAAGSTMTWAIPCAPDEKEGYRYIRIQQNGRNASGENYAISVAGFEIYGRVVGVCEDLNEVLEVTHNERIEVIKQLDKIKPGARVMRGVDWKWDTQNANEEGTVMSNISDDGWVNVKWDDGLENNYRMGADDKYEVKLVVSEQQQEDNSELPTCSTASHSQLRKQTDLARRQYIASIQARHQASHSPRATVSVPNLFNSQSEDSVQSSTSHSFPTGRESLASIMQLIFSNDFEELMGMRSAIDIIANNETNTTSSSFSGNSFNSTLGEYNGSNSVTADSFETFDSDATISADENDVETSQELDGVPWIPGEDLSNIRHILPAFTEDMRSQGSATTNPVSNELSLKRNFSALIPAYDSRLGQSNVNLTKELKVPRPTVTRYLSVIAREKSIEPELDLIIRGPKRGAAPRYEIRLINNDWTIFRAIQEMLQASDLSKADKFRLVWEPTYTLVYQQRAAGDSQVEDTEIASAKVSIFVDNVLQLLSHLSEMNKYAAVHIDDVEEKVTPLPADIFLSNKLNNKMQLQMEDALVLSSDSLPSWCYDIMLSCPFLFSFEMRMAYFNSVAFGAARTIAGLQPQIDLASERQRSVSLRGIGSTMSFRIGRLQHDRVQVPRHDNLLEWAMEVMILHRHRKTVLEVEFENELGTGLGPTLEFYALVACELQRADLCMWLCSNSNDIANELPIFEGVHAPGYYVHSPVGLFPAPLIQDSDVCERACRYFWLLGVFIGKALLDRRRIDLPLSDGFLKLICQGHVLASNADSLCHWFEGVLSLKDLADIEPSSSDFIKSLQKLITEKQNVMTSPKPKEEKEELLRNLKLTFNNESIQFEDLALSFVYLPSSATYGFSYAELVPNGVDIDVNIDNVENYCDLLLRFLLYDGIAKQMKAFKDGFSHVLPLEYMSIFTIDEARLMICGEQFPKWTREDLFQFTEPKLGYTKESPGFLRFVNVLMSMTGPERKAFLQFTTGCSTLPPGGLANLQPRLTIVRKVDADDGTYPSVNTCVHYFKLPEYSSEEIMRERLMTATKTGGFHLN